jgi:hypothetical protein
VSTKPTPPVTDGTRVDLTHLRREIRTAVELSILDFAPGELVDRLAVVAGLLEALAELPADSAPALALAPGTAERARRALADWRAWADLHRKLA